MNWRDRPVILAGHGLRSSGVEYVKLLEIGIPVLSSWQAADLFDSDHPNYYGRPGIWGQRLANRVLYEADQIIALGNRMSLWNVGFNGIRPDHSLTMVDCDDDELARWSQAEKLRGLDTYAAKLCAERPDRTTWLEICDEWRKQMPWVEWHHQDTEKHIHPWRFVDRLHYFLREDEVIVTDMGTALVAAHQVLRLRPPQRLLTSGGLGEMGCALPAAVGASFARGKGEVLCLHCDGGMMMNLQELATIAHHKLPVKIIVFNNSGYQMIKGTQDGAGYERSGVSPDTGVSFPNFHMLAQSFGIQAGTVHTWRDFDRMMPNFFDAKEPCLIDYFMDPECPLLPKLLPIRKPDGTIESPPFWDMNPRIV